jgi:hypothetical protein
MTTPILDLADQVTAYLNDPIWQAPLGYAFTAKRAYLPLKSLIDVAALTVLVIPVDEETTIETRTRTLDDRQINVGIIKKLAAGPDDSFDQTEIDGLFNGLIEPIKTRLKFARLTDYGWIKTKHSPIYDPSHLEQQRQLTSVLTVTYRSLT